MALNFTELKLIKDIVTFLGRTDRKPLVVSLGYPDLLVTREQMLRLLTEEEVAALPIREDTQKIVIEHNREALSTGVYETAAVMAAFGAQMKCMDFRPVQGDELVANLNDPLPETLLGCCDLVIDPGTLEHVFNIGQGFLNVAQMVRVGGFIYHQHPMKFINHGFYSISPTLYRDFYGDNGFDVYALKYFGRVLDQDGLEIELEDSPLRATDDIARYPVINSVVVRKLFATEIRWPIQSIYR